MNLERTLFWIAVVSCVALLAHTLPLLCSQRRGAGWVVVGTAILVVGGAAEIFLPTYAGVVAGTLWAVFIALPSILIRVVLRHALGQRYARAEHVAQMVRWLHPADGWRETPELCRALALAQTGQRDRAADVFHGLMDRPGAPAHVAATACVYLYRMQGQWDQLLAWTEGTASGDQDTLQSGGGYEKGPEEGYQTGYPCPRSQRDAHAGACSRRNRNRKT